MGSVKGSMEREEAVSNVSVIVTHTRASASGTHVGELSMMGRAVAREQYYVKIQQHAQLARGRLKGSALGGWRVAGRGLHSLRNWPRRCFPTEDVDQPGRSLAVSDLLLMAWTNVEWLVILTRPR